MWNSSSERSLPTRQFRLHPTGNTTSWGAHWSDNRCCLSSFTWRLQDPQEEFSHLIFVTQDAKHVCIRTTAFVGGKTNKQINKQTQTLTVKLPHQGISLTSASVAASNEICSVTWPLQLHHHIPSHTPTHIYIHTFITLQKNSLSLKVGMTATFYSYRSGDHLPHTHLH